MSEEIIARPLITITNIIWSFNRQTHAAAFDQAV